MWWQSRKEGETGWRAVWREQLGTGRAAAPFGKAVAERLRPELLHGGILKTWDIAFQCVQRWCPQAPTGRHSVTWKLRSPDGAGLLWALSWLGGNHAPQRDTPHSADLKGKSSGLCLAPGAQPGQPWGCRKNKNMEGAVPCCHRFFRGSETFLSCKDFVARASLSPTSPCCRWWCCHSARSSLSLLLPPSPSLHLLPRFMLRFSLYLNLLLYPHNYSKVVPILLLL